MLHHKLAKIQFKYHENINLNETFITTVYTKLYEHVNTIKH